MRHLETLPREQAPMSRRRVAATTLAIATIAGLLAACGSAASIADGPAPTSPPNVIVIMTDDMRKDDLGAMPQTVELLGGNNGARYANAYVSTPLCCPSRATFLTGQHSHNHGVYTNVAEHGAVDALDDSSTLPVDLQRGGYRTVFLGKYLNGYGTPSDGVAADYVPPGWDHWVGLPKPTTSNYTDFDVTVGSSGSDAPGVGEIHHVADGYQTWNFTSRALSQIETIGQSEQPAFMWLSFFAPHGGQGDYPSVKVPVPPKYRGMTDIGLPESPAVDEVEIADKPAWIEGLPRLSAEDEQLILTQRRERRDALRVVDDSIAKLVDALRETGELDNTVIVFTSDNGYMQGEHRIAKEKTVPYLEAARVPLLVRGPGFTAGTHAEPVSNVDLAPTFTDLAGATSERTMDGVSLLDPIPADRPILVEFLGAGQVGDWSWTRNYSSVIQSGTQYVEYEQGRELYDLVDDPWQLRNRVAQPTMRSMRQDYRGLLAELRDCVGAECLGVAS